MKKRSQRKQKSQLHDYQSLEERKLLAGISFDSTTGVVSIDGSENDDSVWVQNSSAPEISVVFYGVDSQLFSKASVTNIVFTARGGDDWFRNDTSIDASAYGQSGKDRLIGGSGKDRLRGGPDGDYIVGRDNDDYLNGDEHDDYVDGGSGDDRLIGFDGKDRLFGGAGNDFIAAGKGDDFANGGDGNDTLYGSDGKDQLFGGPGDDLIAGQDNDDLIYGDCGFDTLFGNDGSDRMYGGNTADRLYGGNGNDELYGGAGVDLILGEDGNDLVIGGSHADTIYGNDGNDEIYGTDGNDILVGGSGDDRLFGQQGTDKVFGDSGKDILSGGIDPDHLVGGPGNDDFYADSGDAVVNDSEDDNSENDDVYLRPGILSNRLTLSFAPDGTGVFDQTSNLFSAFSGLLSPGQIEETLISSFGIWAANGNLDVGIVADSGDPFGTPGKMIGDSRFGDIRIGAIPMASDVYAVALGQTEIVSGTWAGDILFNSNAQFTSLSQFFSVALHEVGHALGLKHELAIDSAMHRFSNRTDLAPLDIANFQAIYGQRKLDQHDVDESINNNTMALATEISLDSGSVLPGTYPSILFGDINNASDVDFFKYENPSGYNGLITFTVVSDGISLLAPGLSVFNKDGGLIQRVESSSTRGDVLSLSVHSSGSEGKYFVKVDGQNGQSVGSYSLITKLVLLNTVPPATIMTAARTQELSQLEPDDLANYFANPNGYLIAEDNHSNDTFNTATRLETEDGYEGQSFFHYKGSLTDSSDHDFYKLETIRFEGTAQPLLNIGVRSVKTGGLITAIVVFDSNEQVVPAEIVVNGRGEIVVQVSQFSSESEYYVRVATDNLLPFQSGNYELTISYSKDPARFVTRAEGTISTAQKKYHSLHVAESQIMQFGLEASPSAVGSNALLWVTVYDQSGKIVYQGATRPGERRTSDAVYLAPGSYSVEVETNSPLLNGVAYKLTGVEVGDGQGPKFSDPSDSPFPKNPDGDYVYPDNVITDATFVVVDGLASNVPNPPPDQPPGSIYNWFWGI